MTTIGRSERSERSALLGDVTTTAPVPGLIKDEPATFTVPVPVKSHIIYKWGLFVGSIDIMCDTHIKSGLTADILGH